VPISVGERLKLLQWVSCHPIQQAKAAHHRKRSCSNQRRRKLILIEGIFEALPDRREDFVKLALQTMAASQLEKGCSLYRFTADLQDPTHFTLTELWETDKDLKAHHTGDAYKRFFAELPQLGARGNHLAWQGPLVPVDPSQL
jgi:quinol monooxygenase YgiN